MYGRKRQVRMALTVASAKMGRSGALNALLEWGFGLRPTRWIYGLPGVWLAQTLALTPVASNVPLPSKSHS